MTYVVLLMHVSFLKALQHHLGVQRVQNLLRARDTAVLSEASDLVWPRLADEVEQLRIHVVQALDRACRAERERDKGGGRERAERVSEVAQHERASEAADHVQVRRAD